LQKVLIVYLLIIFISNMRKLIMLQAMYDLTVLFKKINDKNEAFCWRDRGKFIMIGG